VSPTRPVGTQVTIDSASSGGHSVRTVSSRQQELHCLASPRCASDAIVLDRIRTRGEYLPHVRDGWCTCGVDACPHKVNVVVRKGESFGHESKLLLDARQCPSAIPGPLTTVTNLVRFNRILFLKNDGMKDYISSNVLFGK
jgi:hypothetical protein